METDQHVLPVEVDRSDEAEGLDQPMASRSWTAADDNHGSHTALTRST